MGVEITNAIKDKIQQENVNGLIAINKVILGLHIALLLFSDSYSYFGGLWEQSPFLSGMLIARISCVVVALCSLRVNISYQKGKKPGNIFSYSALLILNVLLIYPIILYYYYVDLKYHHSPGVMILSMCLLSFVWRLPPKQLILLIVFLTISFFGIVFSLKISYSEYTTLYTNGIATIIICYFVSSMLYKHTYAKVRNEILLKKSHQQLDILNKDLSIASKTIKEQNQLLKESNNSLSNFAHIAAHDIKSPLRTISSFSNILSRRYKDKMTPKDQELQDLVVSGCQDLTHIIDNLLEFSKISSNEHFILETVNLNDLISRCVYLLEQDVREKSAEIHIAENFPDIKGVKELLQEVFTNLFSNALKFAKPDTNPNIQITHRILDNKWLEITVKDDGIGIAPEFQEEMFLLFRKLHHSSSYEGSGIGLAICKKIIQKHGGEIHVESELGDGAAFVFTLPLVSS